MKLYTVEIFNNGENEGVSAQIFAFGSYRKASKFFTAEKRTANIDSSYPATVEMFKVELYDRPHKQLFIYLIQGCGFKSKTLIKSADLPVDETEPSEWQ